MKPYLNKRSWAQFKVVVRLRLGECSMNWDSNISRKIFDIIHTEEIRERFLSGFRYEQIFSSEKLDLSLDDIINPIRIFEKRSHKRGCHPGRLTLNAKEYHRAITGNDSLAPNYLRAGFLSTPWGNHRLLDVSEDINNPVRAALTKKGDQIITWGLQDVYFLGGLPLIYWSKGDAMGMKVPTEPLMQDIKTPGGYLPANPRQHFQWRSLEELSEYTRMWYLPTEVSWRYLGGIVGRLFVDITERVPRTWHGNKPWITGQTVGVVPAEKRQLRGQDYVHFAYIMYIQQIEDLETAVKCLGERVRKFSRRTAQELTLYGSPELPPT